MESAVNGYFEELDISHYKQGIEAEILSSLGTGINIIHSILHNYLYVEKLFERRIPCVLKNDEVVGSRSV